MTTDEQAITVDEFCFARRMSKSLYYKLKVAGRGPRELRLGRLVRITAAAARDFDLANEVAG
jgi:hypothetical protein